jgi:hypothetical protein
VKTLEDIIRSAARATADEIDPATLPHLQLPPPQRQSPASRRRSRPQGAGLRRMAAPVAAASAVLAVAAVSVAIVWQGSARHLPAAPGEAGSSAEVPTAAPVQLAWLDQGVIDQFLPATGAQFTTGALFYGQIIALESDLTSTCMARHGFHYPRTSAAAAAAGDYDLTQFPDLARISRTGMLVSDFAVLTQPRWSRAFEAQLAPCTAAATALFQPLLTVGRRLAGPFIKTELSGPTPAAVLATLPGLRSCAARYGWPAQPYGAPHSIINSFADFADWVAGHIAGAASRGASGAELRALNHLWAPIFVTCARPAVTAQYKLWIAERSRYLRQHGRQVQALLALARQIFATAERQAGSVITP